MGCAGAILYKFALNLVLNFALKSKTETAPFNGAIWDEFIKKH